MDQWPVPPPSTRGGRKAATYVIDLRNTHTHLSLIIITTMPTQLPRVQALIQPETYAKVRQLAKYNRRSSSFTVADLVEELLNTDKYKVLLDYIAEKEGEVPVQEDTRTRTHQPRTQQPRIHKMEKVQSSKPAQPAQWW